MFKKNKDRLAYLERENGRLKIDIISLEKKLELSQKYENEYKEIVKDLRKQKEKHKKFYSNMQGMATEYKKELEKIKNK